MQSTLAQCRKIQRNERGSNSGGKIHGTGEKKKELRAGGEGGGRSSQGVKWSTAARASTEMQNLANLSQQESWLQEVVLFSSLTLY